MVCGSVTDMLALEPHPKLGPHLETMKVHHVVPGGTWHGARLSSTGAWALPGTTLAPGFDYRDHEKGTHSLNEQYPMQRRLIDALLDQFASTPLNSVVCTAKPATT